MGIMVKDFDLADYNAWSGAKEFWEEICDAGKIGDFECYINEIYPEGVDSPTTINDILWFEEDDVRRYLDMEEEPEEDEDEEEHCYWAVTLGENLIKPVDMADLGWQNMTEYPSNVQPVIDKAIEQLVGTPYVQPVLYLKNSEVEGCNITWHSNGQYALVHENDIEVRELRLSDVVYILDECIVPTHFSEEDHDDVLDKPFLHFDEGECWETVFDWAYENLPK